MARQLEHFPNLVTMFFTRAAEQGDAPFLWAKRDGQWRSTSWREAARQVAALAESLKRIGLERGDRVMLVSENRPEWLIADLGIMAAGCVTVPTYTTNTTRDHTHMLGNSGAKAVIVSNQKLAKTLVPAVLFASECHHLIGIEPIRTGQSTDDVNYHHWPDLVAGEPDRAARRAEPRGGRPRRPRLHHLHQRHRRRAARRPAASRRDPRTTPRAASTSSPSDFGWDDEVFLSFLPASHAYEHSGGQHFPIALGAQIYYAESLEKLAANIEEVRPTIMVVVPAPVRNAPRPHPAEHQEGRPVRISAQPRALDRRGQICRAASSRGICRWTASCR